MNFGPKSSDPLGPSAHNDGVLSAEACKPLNCETAMRCLEGVRDPRTTAYEMSQLRGEVAGCVACLYAIDVEIRIRMTVTPSTSSLPTADFRMRITETLATVDLSKLDITDL